jgi:beta-lysine 5,6-aminomutase alpha subunit
VRTTLHLDHSLVEECHVAAQDVADDVLRRVAGKTTTSIERTVLRLLGVNGADADGVPLANRVVDDLHRRGVLDRGVAYWFGNAMLHGEQSPMELSAAVARGEVDLVALPRFPHDAVAAVVADECDRRIRMLSGQWEDRARFRRQFEERPPPHLYVLTATGDVHQDVVHARAVADHGGDIVAVIRSTVQSLLDYVPDGLTVQGYGGTFATQANFRLLRRELDDWCRENGRYVQLSSFCSGLCMPEIALLGAMEGFDNMVNDALYGILYRNIDIVRTLVDQKVSRQINGYFGIVINTGEDNYLRTADAVAAAPSVLASQFINYYLARGCGVPEAQIGLGGAFETDPATPNGMLYEVAQATLTRELFPRCPVKYMPPTRHMDGNVFRTHAADTLFNLVTVIAGQRIQTIGVPTEGVFTPHLHDRMISLENARYVVTFAHDLGNEIQFIDGGVIRTRAAEVLREAHGLLVDMTHTGLLAAIEKGVFGDVSRTVGEGVGGDGTVTVSADYIDPCPALIGARPHDG